MIWGVLAALSAVAAVYCLGRAVEIWAGRPRRKRTRGHWTGDQE